MAKGIKDLHKDGISIVDFKEDNVLIKRKSNKDFKVFVTDFSWAYFQGRGHTSMMSSWVNHQHRHGHSMLTGQNNSTAFCLEFPHYAPELLGDTIDKSVDIYSFGEVLRHVMTKSARLTELLRPLAKRCKNMQASERPTIKKVVKEVKNLLKQCKVGKIRIPLLSF